MYQQPDLPTCLSLDCNINNKTTSQKSFAFNVHAKTYFLSFASILIFYTKTEET